MTRVPSNGTGFEQQLIEFSDCAPQPILSVGADGVIEWANQAALALLGYSAGEYVGQPMRAFHDNGPDSSALLLRMLSGQNMQEIPSELRCKDGSVKDVLFTCNALWAEGRFVRARCFMRDLTERSRLERELRAVLKRNDEFLAMLGHELRNPLAPIANGSVVIRRLTAGNTAVARLCDMLDRQTAILRRLLDDLLDVSRLNQGKMRFMRQPLELQSIVQAAVEMCRAAIERQRHTLQLTIPSQPARILGDNTRLTQAIANLLGNAIKFTPEGGEIAVTCVEQEQQVVLRVCDNGTGIDPEILPRVFDLFVQGEPGKGRLQTGLGVGLALARRIVQAHDGTIAAFSPGPGRGAEFVLTLPSLQPAPQAR